jgi:transcriptional regulator of nitric oxide reductase
MGMHFEELDEATRAHMLTEFKAEEASGNPYRSRILSAAGRTAFPQMMEDAIRTGSDVTLTAALQNQRLFNPTETYERNGVQRERRINIAQASERLALTEFNTWYVCGLCKRLIVEGVKECQAYRGAQPKREPAECSAHEEQVFLVEAVYRSHRARYWPEPGNPSAISIPFGPGCHHTIRRYGV